MSSAESATRARHPGRDQPGPATSARAPTPSVRTTDLRLGLMEGTSGGDRSEHAPPVRRQTGEETRPYVLLAQVRDAWKMLSIEVSSMPSNSSADWWAERPSLSAREKLAIMPVLRDRRSFASSRG